jgi:nuclear pore complex protein Nup133
VLTVREIYLLNAQRPDPRPLSTPKLSIGTGEIAFVVFADAVVLMSLSNGKFI